jgi:hypothetical protein
VGRRHLQLRARGPRDLPCCPFLTAVALGRRAFLAERGATRRFGQPPRPSLPQRPGCLRRVVAGNGAVEHLCGRKPGARSGSLRPAGRGLPLVRLGVPRGTQPLDPESGDTVRGLDTPGARLHAAGTSWVVDGPHGGRRSARLEPSGFGLRPGLDTHGGGLHLQRIDKALEPILARRDGSRPYPGKPPRASRGSPRFAPRVAETLVEAGDVGRARAGAGIRTARNRPEAAALAVDFDARSARHARDRRGLRGSEPGHGDAAPLHLRPGLDPRP